MFDYTFHWRVVLKQWPQLLKAGLLTLEITVFSILFGLVIAMLLAVLRKSENKTLRTVAGAWVACARNTPALLQIYIAYFGLGTFGLHLSPYISVLSAITFNNAGYLTEILRGGIDAINPAQRQTALGLGLTPFQVYVYVIFPQVLKVVFLPISNQIILAMLNSSMGMVIGLQELTGMTTFLQSQTFRPFEFYFAAAVIYFVVAKVASIAAGLVAVRYFKGK
ncbi:Ribose ABC transport system, permease protein RbsC (TC 3.A.1.2.1) [Olavius algarvensis Delta 1 endosymbiont]|nr:Ribose ABC transport system, permease protein RbsC (TC 3.A.1.2.1) [Olavius algarvensis Delta 1 endosymbiont]